MVAAPRRIIVGPHRYDVHVVPGGLLGEAGEAGHCTVTRCRIAICDDQAPSQQAATVMHEVCHALLDLVGLDAEQEERVALVLGPGLVELIADNPELVDWITSTTEDR